MLSLQLEERLGICVRYWDPIDCAPLENFDVSTMKSPLMRVFQNIDVELLSVAPLAETRMKLDFKLFKGASIRFHDQQMAQVHAARLVSTNPAVKKGMSIPNYPVSSTSWAFFSR